MIKREIYIEIYRDINIHIYYIIIINIMTLKKEKVPLLKEEFAKFSTGNVIDESGFIKMGKVLDIDIYSDIFILYFCYRCECKQFGAISLEEFSRGLKSFNSVKLDEVKKKIIHTKEDLLEITSSDFKKFYYFIFDYLYDKKNSKKTLGFDEVVLYFKQFFSSQYKIVDKFIEFLIKNKGKEGLKQDQWNCFLEFIIKIGDAFPKGYSIKDSWPTLFDEFYYDYCERNNIDINEEENEEI